jgi:hypothetical protein
LGEKVFFWDLYEKDQQTPFMEGGEEAEEKLLIDFNRLESTP